MVKNIILILFFLCSCVQTPANIIYKKSNQKTKTLKNPYKIIVEEGDTLYKISKKYDVNIRNLIEKNNLKAPFLLSKGQYLLLPKARFHIVKKDDYLYAIANSYGVNLKKLKQINNIKSDYNLQIGSKLKLPTLIFTENTPDNIKNEEEYIVTYNKDLKNIPYPLLKPQNNQNDKNIKPILKSKKVKKENYKLPNKKQKMAFIWPVKGSIISKYGPKKGGLYNDGINISGKIGDIVKTVEEGQVIYAGNELRGYGNLIIIKHANNYISTYAHNKSIMVKKGDIVKKGQKIAFMGKTGSVSSAQLHFGIRKGRKALNPEKYLPLG